MNKLSVACDNIIGAMPHVNGLNGGKSGLACRQGVNNKYYCFIYDNIIYISPASKIQTSMNNASTNI